MTQFPILYHKAKAGAIHSWKIWTEGNTVFTEHGQIEGKKQISSFYALPKNVGKKNATTAEEQAIAEAKSKWTHKKERKYSESIEKASDPVYLPMLAHDFKKRKAKDVHYPVNIQPKLDGVRAVAAWHNGKVRLTSRSGKEWIVPQHICRELERILPASTVLDGEIYIHGEALEDINSWTKKFDPVNTPRLQYHVYDMPVDSEGNDDLTWKQRSNNLLNFYKEFPSTQSIRNVPLYIAKNEKLVYEYEETFVIEGYEGAIIRNPDGLYVGPYRSYDLLKLKNFQDAEFKVVGFKEGKGKYTGCVVWQCITNEGETFDVTPKITLEKKKWYFDRGNEYIGKMLTVKFFNYSKVKKIPIYPVGKTFRDEKDMS